MDEYPLQVERYYFLRQSVIANPDHDANGRKDGSDFKSEVNVNPIAGETLSLAISVTLFLDEETSENPPYFFHIQAFGIFSQVPNLPTEVAQLLATFPAEAAQQLAAKTGIRILVGAIRERLADLTCRAPWGIFMLGSIPLEFQASPPVGQSSN